MYVVWWWLAVLGEEHIFQAVGSNSSGRRLGDGAWDAKCYACFSILLSAACPAHWLGVVHALLQGRKQHQNISLQPEQQLVLFTLSVLEDLALREVL